MSTVVAFDWGGTWIRAALVEDGELRPGVRKMARPESVGAQFDAVAALAEELARDALSAPAGIGIGIAGIVREGGRLASAGNLGLTGIRLRAEVEARTGRAVRVVNDTQAAALAEAAATGSQETVVLLTIGTGIGGAVVHSGRIVAGCGAAGDFGHTPLSVDGPLCTCGARGCFEQLVSGRVLNEEARRLAASGASPPLAAIAEGGRALHGGDLEVAAGTGDPAARSVLEHAAVVLASGLRAVAAACDPAVIVVGGGVLPPGSRLWDLTVRAWNERRTPWTVARLVPARCGDEAAIAGAALLFGSQGGPGRRDVS